MTKPLLYSLVLLLGLSCSTQDPPPAPPKAPLAGTPRARIGPMHFRQLIQAYEDATSISAQNKALRDGVEALRTRLAADHHVQSHSPTALLATVVLASHFCKAFIELETKLVKESRKAHVSIDFDSPEKTLESHSFQEVSHAYAERFWHRRAEHGEATELAQLIKDTSQQALQDGKTAAEALFEALLSGCTASAASWDAWVAR